MFNDIMITSLELEEMAMEAAENDGRLARRPLKHAEREVHAHRKLLLHLDNMIQGQSTAIEARTLITTTKNSVSLKCY
jgi:histone-lysine N-methyltransferase SETD3